MVKNNRRALMQAKEWTKINHNSQLDVGLLHARFAQHAYPRHSHDYYQGIFFTSPLGYYKPVIPLAK